ncbi:hypothetical protein SAMN05428989_2797 [Pseudoxanthomonas sp. GM95]|uniref:OpgC domain-containing protein n=1 Tax=Pseudoxanthomonas sp. GM95 TaxID=1881043 RepID=UPI0008CF300E|nr:OpgC domain-containing protein [Pseudoxanthomonas sp. GM95]SEL89093.1 hypothetical protein SAMN05428989_2797 [Pseudoxanthomonas sp. GM95]
MTVAAVASPARPASARIESLDFIRGACLIVIAFDHISSFSRKLGYTGREFFTPTTLGYSSAAELFLFVSGVLIGILHTRPGVSFSKRFVKLSHRAGHLYLYNALAFVVLLAATTGLATYAMEALELSRFAHRPGESTIDFLLMSSSPPLLDILSLYVCFLLVSVLFVPLSLRSPALAFALSLLLYAVCQWPPARQALGLQAEGQGLNPYAWQLCFMAGVVCGQLGLLARLEALMRQKPAVILTISALAIMTLAFVADRKLGLTDAWWWDKHELGVFRIPHAALVLAAYIWLSCLLRDPRMPAVARWLHEALASMGRHSLEVFTVGIALTYAVSLLVGELRPNTAVFYLILAGVAIVLWLFARYLEWRRAVAR